MSVEINNDIINEFSSGGENAFHIIYKKYSPSIRFFVNKILQGNLSSDDIVQDTFVRLWENRKSMKKEISIKSFLYKTSNNLALDYLRHKKVILKYENEIYADKCQESFLDNIIEAETFSFIHKLFKQLSISEQKVYKLSLEGKSYKEISEICHISINTVKKHKYNANLHMRKYIKYLSLLIISISKEIGLNTKKL